MGYELTVGVGQDRRGGRHIVPDATRSAEKRCDEEQHAAHRRVGGWMEVNGFGNREPSGRYAA